MKRILLTSVLVPMGLAIVNGCSADDSAVVGEQDLNKLATTLAGAGGNKGTGGDANPAAGGKRTTGASGGTAGSIGNGGNGVKAAWVKAAMPATAMLAGRHGRRGGAGGGAQRQSATGKSDYGSTWKSILFDQRLPDQGRPRLHHDPRLPQRRCGELRGPGRGHQGSLPDRWHSRTRTVHRHLPRSTASRKASSSSRRYARLRGNCDPGEHDDCVASTRSTLGGTAVGVELQRDQAHGAGLGQAKMPPSTTTSTRSRRAQARSLTEPSTSSYIDTINVPGGGSSSTSSEDSNCHAIDNCGDGDVSDTVCNAARGHSETRANPLLRAWPSTPNPAHDVARQAQVRCHRAR